MLDTKRTGLGALVLLLPPLLLLAQPARAEVVSTAETGFVVRVASEVTAKPADAWRTLISPALWWQGQHTFSGDAANLTLDPVPGGCFCEALPRPEGAPAAQKAGGVQHMRVVYIEPPRAMRLVGALGPLQSEALSATMTMTVKPTDKGSRILFEYVAGGFMRYKVGDIAPAVDRMLSAQLLSLAGKLGPVVEPADDVPAGLPKPSAAMGPPSSDDELPPALGNGKAVGPLSGVESYSLPPARSAAPARAVRTPAPAKAPEKPAAKAPAIPSVAPPATPSLKPAVAKPSARSAAIGAGIAAPVAAASAVKPAPKPAPKPAVKPAGKVAGKPAPKRPDPEVDAHRDANALFDAALGAEPAP